MRERTGLSLGDLQLMEYYDEVGQGENQTLSF